LSNENPVAVQPHLIALSGPFKGQTYKLEDELLIGRKDATLALNAPSVSKQHCSIRKEGVRYVLRDLESHNGTFVNGERIAERILEHGDQIQVGEYQFLVALLEEEIPQVSAGIQLVDQDLDSTHSFVLRAEDAEYLHPKKGLAGFVTDERIRCDLSTLLRIGASVNATGNLSSLQDHLIGSILEAIPVDAGTILLVQPDGRITASFAQSFTETGTLPVSRTIVDRVSHEHTSLMVNGIQCADIDAPSLLLSGARALLCVPLIVRDRTVGVIYLIRTKNQNPFDEHDLQLLTAIASMAAPRLETARQVEWLQSEHRRLQTELDSQHQMIGKSAATQNVYNFISRVAATGSTVLLGGESGTGKELVARAIHRLSTRAKMAFIAVNCAAITESLVESELFGHEKGAFTGAVSLKKGKFEAAEGGTIFLDEVGELPLPIQGKLLRAIQEREINRVGNPLPTKINVRIIAASNRNLEEDSRNGRFRSDLFFRLNVVALKLPPLRDRRDDILPLARHFLTKSNVKCNRHVAGISADAAEYIRLYDWPGNIRELENAIERAVVLGLSDMILPEDLPETVLNVGQLPPGEESKGFHQAVAEAKRHIILRALDQTGGNHLEAAKLLGLNRTYLHRLTRSLGIDRPGGAT
jgi:Nif-specific regulatory protein